MENETQILQEIAYLQNEGDEGRCTTCKHANLFHVIGPDNQWLEDCIIRDCTCKGYTQKT